MCRLFCCSCLSIKNKMFLQASSDIFHSNLQACPGIFHRSNTPIFSQIQSTDIKHDHDNPHHLICPRCIERRTFNTQSGIVSGFLKPFYSVHSEKSCVHHILPCSPMKEEGAGETKQPPLSLPNLTAFLIFHILDACIQTQGIMFLGKVRQHRLNRVLII